MGGDKVEEVEEFCSDSACEAVFVNFAAVTHLEGSTTFSAGRTTTILVSSDNGSTFNKKQRKGNLHGDT